jgi:peroxiredoxin
MIRRFWSLVGVILALAASSAWAGGLAIGARLTPFSLVDTSGHEVSLAANKGSAATVVIFVATRCPVSNAYNERMSKLAAEYRAEGVSFVGINANRQEDAAEVAAHAREHGFTFPIYKDPGNVRADELAAQVTPEVFLFDASWTLRYHGRIDDSRDESGVQTHDLHDALEAVLAGKQPAVTETKAFGCTIKRVTP